MKGRIAPQKFSAQSEKLIMRAHFSPSTHTLMTETWYFSRVCEFIDLSPIFECKSRHPRCQRGGACEIYAHCSLSVQLTYRHTLGPVPWVCDQKVNKSSHCSITCQVSPHNFELIILIIYQVNWNITFNFSKIYTLIRQILLVIIPINIFLEN